jgi:hypothetical protein
MQRPTFDPLDLADVGGYRRWRDWKLAVRAADVHDLLVPVRDPQQLSADERRSLLAACERENMALYRCDPGITGRGLPLALGRQLGLHRLDLHWLAGDEGVSLITASGADAERADFIPYTDRPIRWHTDGYYNASADTIHAMVLHCVQPAASGGTNALLDHDLLYIALRDENPRWIAALAAPDAMTIPARLSGDQVARAAQGGPVWSREARSGGLHLRYTARTRSIEWADDALTREAVARITELLADDRIGVRRIRLDAGMGIVANNVLHDRSAFVDDPLRPRLLYRARFRDRVDAPHASPAAAPTLDPAEAACPIG